MLYILAAIGGFIFGLMVFAYLFLVLGVNIFKTIEHSLLLSATELIQYKHHAIKILELSYDKAAEEDKTKTEEFKQIVQKINEKFDSYGESWIQYLIARLPYKTEYKDWKTGLAYIEGLLSINKIKK